MANIKEQIAGLKARFDALQASLEQQAKSSGVLRNELAKLSASIDLLVKTQEQLESLPIKQSRAAVEESHRVL